MEGVRFVHSRSNDVGTSFTKDESTFDSAHRLNALKFGQATKSKVLRGAVFSLF